MIPEVYEWVRQVAVQQQAECPVLEIGSYNVNGSCRDLFFGKYVGLDMREGPGVDVIADIVTDGWYRAGPDRFKTVICTETLEHVTDPWKATERMFDALEPDGLLIVSIPFLWNFHDYPSDYWRITPPGMELVLERAGFEQIDARFGGQKLDEEHTYSHTLAIARKPSCLHRNWIGAGCADCGAS